MQNYKETYRKVFEFHEKCCDIKNKDDWYKLASDLKQFKGPFETELMIVIVKEIERAYKANTRDMED